MLTASDPVTGQGTPEKTVYACFDFFQSGYHFRRPGFIQVGFGKRCRDGQAVQAGSPGGSDAEGGIFHYHGLLRRDLKMIECRKIWLRMGLPLFDLIAGEAYGEACKEVLRKIAA